MQVIILADRVGAELGREPAALGLEGDRVRPEVPDRDDIAGLLQAVTVVRAAPERTFDVEILKCIDGRASIEDIVVILSSRYGLAPDRCRNTVNRFFGRLIEGDE